jgi:hypothetical protein
MIKLRLVTDDRLNIQQVLWSMGNGLQDIKIFRSWQAQGYHA